MDPTYGASYGDLYRRHWWWRAREEYLVRLLDRVVGAGGAGQVLDFGCGDGLFFPKLERYGETRGVEPDASLLDAAGPWRARISTGSLTDDPAERERYGLIVALDVLEHIEDPTPVVSLLRKRLRPGGYFVVTVPAFQSLWTSHDEFNRHFRRYRLDALESLVRGAGFDVEDARYLFSWLAPAKLLVALRERFLAGTPVPAKVPAAPINAAALALSRLEQRVVRGWKPPFGSSALLVARVPLSRGGPPSP